MDAPNVSLTPDFLPESDALFHELRETVAWDERMHARKTASFGIPYDYSGMTYAETPMHPRLLPIVDHLETLLGFRPNNCLLNLYEGGKNTMGFHVDSLVGLASGTGVAIVSLGAERTLTFRRLADKTVTAEYRLPGGSLLYMPPEVQSEWQHGVREERGAGSRISLTFRQVATA